jgi:hypothetical protein
MRTISFLSRWSYERTMHSVPSLLSLSDKARETEILTKILLTDILPDV